MNNFEVIHLQELVGKCQKCEASIYCLDGFLNGIIIKQLIYCFSCYEEMNNQKSLEDDRGK